MKQGFNRKDFLKASCSAACALLLTGVSSSCSSSQVIAASRNGNGKVSIPLSAFTQSGSRIVRVEKATYDFLIVKRGPEDFIALVMRCSHQDWNLTANKGGLSCGLHGSTFNLNGQVVNGPATEPLMKLQVLISGDELILTGNPIT